ncbi:MAG: hypothetical protein OSB82_06800 [Alphaproteobacteria bacterium]|nr:hypothetical protein [Alphaproteobacteria bacterium]
MAIPYDRQNPHRARRAVQLADHRIPHHRLGTGGQALQHPAQDQRVDGAGVGAKSRGGGKADHAQQQHRPPPDAVRQGTPKQLRQGIGDQVQGQGQLHPARIRAEDALQMGQ